MYVKTDYNGRKIYKSTGTLYLWHKDNCCSINARDVKVGDKMYISIYDDIVVDGYNGMVGKPEDFHEKLEVEYEFTIPSNSEEFQYINEEGEVDFCEAEWVTITHITTHTCKTVIEHLESVLNEKTGLKITIVEDGSVLLIFVRNNGDLDFEMYQNIYTTVQNIMGQDFQVHEPFCLNHIGTTEAMFVNIPCEIIPNIDTLI